MPPERSVPRVTAVALDVGHGVVVVVVLAVTLTHSLSLSLSLSYLRRDDGVLDGSAARCQFFSNLLEQFKTPLARFCVLSRHFRGKFGKVRDFRKSKDEDKD